MRSVNTITPMFFILLSIASPASALQFVGDGGASFLRVTVLVDSGVDSVTAFDVGLGLVSGNIEGVQEGILAPGFTIDSITLAWEGGSFDTVIGINNDIPLHLELDPSSFFFAPRDIDPILHVPVGGSIEEFTREFSGPLTGTLNGIPFALYDITLPDTLPTQWTITSPSELNFVLGVPEPIFPNHNTSFALGQFAVTVQGGGEVSGATFIPEPSAASLLALGLVGIAAKRRRSSNGRGSSYALRGLPAKIGHCR